MLNTPTRTKRMLVGSIAGLAAATWLLACGSEGPTAIGSDAPAATASSVTDGIQDAPASIDDFREAWGGMPVSLSAEVGAVQESDVLARSESLVVGTLTAIAPRSSVSIDRGPLQCESQEGTPTEGSCSAVYTYEAVDVVLSGAKQYADGGKMTNEVEEVRVTVLVGSPDDERTRSSLARLSESAPLGAEVAAFVFEDSLGLARFVHPEAWAIVLSDGSLANMVVEPDRAARSLLGAGSVDELIAVASK